MSDNQPSVTRRSRSPAAFFTDDFDQMHRSMENQIEAENAEWRKTIDDRFQRIQSDFFNSDRPLSSHLSNDHLQDPFSVNAAAPSSGPCTPSFDKKKNGEIDYVVRCDIPDYSADSVALELVDQKLHISAKAATNTIDGVSQSKTFSKTLTLPVNCDLEKITSSRSKDGVLEIRCAVKPPNFPSQYRLDDNKNVLIENVIPKLNRVSLHVPSDDTGRPNSAPDRIHPDRYIKTVTLSEEYAPEEIDVAVKQGKIIVSAKREEKKNNRSTKMKFSETYDVPSAVDLTRLTCKLAKSGVVHLEAPYKRKEPEDEVSIPVRLE